MSSLQKEHSMVKWITIHKDCFVIEKIFVSDDFCRLLFRVGEVDN